jgi:propanol-preferring alcohol dehydrogenase
MKAIQYSRIGGRLEMVELAMPEPGPGEIRLKITAARACRSDEFIMSAPADQYPYPLPLTLGHEAAGVVDKLWWKHG